MMEHSNRGLAVSARVTAVVVALAVVAAVTYQVTTRDPAVPDASDPLAPAVASDPSAPDVASTQETLAEYLSGEVTIGVNGKLPGWSVYEGPTKASGFDIALVEFLRKKYRFTPHYVELLPSEREDALTSRVKVIMANYSRTAEREKFVDFAGPYFKDQSGVMCLAAKLACDKPIEQTNICVTLGTEMAKKLKDARKEASLADCMQAFYGPDQSIGAVATDLAILQAYGDSIGYSVSAAKWANEKLHPISEEAYGIGLPNNRPDLCRALNADIDKFLADRKSGWDNAFSNNLPNLAVFGRNPEKTDPAWCTDTVSAS